MAEPIEAVALTELDDKEFEKTDWDAGSTASTSITSSILQHSYENGRRVSRAFTNAI
jgi:hypothetical protein